MISREILRFRKGDILAVSLVLVLAALVAAAYWPRGNQSGAWAEIYQNNQLIHRMSLDEEQSFTVRGEYTNQIEVRQGRIAITESDCPGGDCVFIGFVGTPNRSIVCLPNGVEIRIVADEAEVDFVVR